MITKDLMVAERSSIENGFGYYKVGETYYTNAVAAFKAATALGVTDVTYHFLDSVYGSLDWSKEPTESLDELYKQRAQQLRDKYDYLILSFSGGGDSYNVLRSFIDNGIHLDEVVSWYPLSVIEKRISGFNVLNTHEDNIIFEYEMACRPALKWLEKVAPKTKITVIDYAEPALAALEGGHILDAFQSDEPGGGPQFGLYGFGWQACNVLTHQRSGDGKDVALITGADKPGLMLSMTTGKFGFFTTAITFDRGSYLPRHLASFKPKVEHFYWSAEAPLIPQKQAFVLRRAYLGIKGLGSMKHQFIRRDADVAVFRSDTELVKTSLYSNWTGAWQSKKMPSTLYAEAAKWLEDRDLVAPSTFNRLRHQIDDLVQGVDSRWLQRRPDGLPDRFKLLFTKPIWF